MNKKISNAIYFTLDHAEKFIGMNMIQVSGK